MSISHSTSYHRHNVMYIWLGKAAKCYED